MDGLVLVMQNACVCIKEDKNPPPPLKNAKHARRFVLERPNEWKARGRLCFCFVFSVFPSSLWRLLWWLMLPLRCAPPSSCFLLSSLLALPSLLVGVLVFEIVLSGFQGGKNQTR